MQLSIIMPVYNEISTIAEIIHRVLAAPIEIPKELIVVDDCSTDGTREYLKDLQKRTESTPESAALKVLFHPHNRGKGAALRTARAQATGEIILIQEPTSNTIPRIIPPSSSRSSTAGPMRCSATASTAGPTVCSISGMRWGTSCSPSSVIW
jgi:hypothetical protein